MVGGTPNKTAPALKICPTGIYGQRMELEVLKALGDETRYALYRELAEAYPELVCNLHRGICEGVAEAGRGTVEQFSTLYEPDPCHVVVAVP